MRYRLRQLARLVGAAVITVAVAGAAVAVAIYLTGSSGLISCVPAPAPARPDAIPRWVIAAGIPALVAALIGAFFALAAERVLARLIGLVLTVVLAAATFYAVYTLLPAGCRP
jgi:predicted lysophospholipase L1 biosynthesis ABC-type transport system permease subunit